MFTNLRVDSVQVLYNLSQDQHTHPDMTEPACQKLRLHTMTQGGKVHEAVDKMREKLVDGKNLENMRIQLAHALQCGMRQAWSLERVRGNNRCVFPFSPEGIRYTLAQLTRALAHRPGIFPAPASRR